LSLRAAGWPGPSPVASSLRPWRATGDMDNGRPLRRCFISNSGDGPVDDPGTFAAPGEYGDRRLRIRPSYEKPTRPGRCPGGLHPFRHAHRARVWANGRVPVSIVGVCHGANGLRAPEIDDIQKQKRGFTRPVRSHDGGCDVRARIFRPASYRSMTSRQCARNAFTRSSGLSRCVASTSARSASLASFDSMPMSLAEPPG